MANVNWGIALIVAGSMTLITAGTLFQRIGEYESYYDRNAPSSLVAFVIGVVLLGVGLIAGGVYLLVRKRSRETTTATE